MGSYLSNLGSDFSWLKEKKSKRKRMERYLTKQTTNPTKMIVLKKDEKKNECMIALSLTFLWWKEKKDEQATWRNLTRMREEGNASLSLLLSYLSFHLSLACIGGGAVDALFLAFFIIFFHSHKTLRFAFTPFPHFVPLSSSTCYLTSLFILFLLLLFFK